MPMSGVQFHSGYRLCSTQPAIPSPHSVVYLLCGWKLFQSCHGEFRGSTQRTRAFLIYYCCWVGRVEVEIVFLLLLWGGKEKKCNCVVLLLVILSLPCSFAFSLVPIHTIQLKLNYIGLHSSSSLAFFPFFALRVHYFYVCKAWEIVLDAKNGCTVDGLDCQL